MWHGQGQFTKAGAFFLTATPVLKWHPSLRQNCSALPPASLSGEGSGEGRRGFCTLLSPCHRPFHLFARIGV